MEAKRVSETRTALAQLMTPNDANVLGKVFGGSILALIDLAASATAQRFCGHVSVTASFDRVDFHEPIEIGSLVELIGHIGYAGRTSMEVTVDVFATRLPSSDRRHTNTGRVTMVALDGGVPTAVPKLLCETREERLAFLEGQLRRELRQQRIAEFQSLTEKLAAISEATLKEWVEQCSRDKHFSVAKHINH